MRRVRFGRIVFVTLVTVTLAAWIGFWWNQSQFTEQSILDWTLAKLNEGKIYVLAEMQKRGITPQILSFLMSGAAGIWTWLQSREFVVHSRMRNLLEAENRRLSDARSKLAKVISEPDMGRRLQSPEFTEQALGSFLRSYSLRSILRVPLATEPSSKKLQRAQSALEADCKIHEGYLSFLRNQQVAAHMLTAVVAASHAARTDNKGLAATFHDRAINSFRSALKVFPDKADPEVTLLYANQLIRGRNYDEAEQMLAKHVLADDTLRSMGVNDATAMEQAQLHSLIAQAQHGRMEPTAPHPIASMNRALQLLANRNYPDGKTVLDIASMHECMSKFREKRGGILAAIDDSRNAQAFFADAENKIASQHPTIIKRGWMWLCQWFLFGYTPDRSKELLKSAKAGNIRITQKLLSLQGQKTSEDSMAANGK